MPLTSISIKQWDMIAEIFNHRIPFNVNLKNFQAQYYRELTRQHQKAIYQVFKDLLGESAYVDIWLDERGPDFTNVQQTIIDANAKTFVNRYKDLDKADIIELTAEIDGMQETTLTVDQWTEITDILDF